MGKISANTKNFFEVEEGDNMPQLEVFLSDGETVENDGLVWKEILREGEWAFRPGPGQKPVPVPLKVIAGNATAKKEIGMQDLIDAFEEQAIDHVTVPTSHDDKPHENTGFVRKLKTENRNGKTRLMAGIEFTEPDIKGKVTRKSIANTSAGIVFEYVKKDSGKVYSQALGHVALTNKPWINGMESFSEDEIDNSESYLLTDIVWDQKQSYGWIREQVSNSVQNLISPGEELFVNDIANSNALISKHDKYTGKVSNYVVPFSVSNEKLVISDEEDWVEAKQEWVKTSEILNKNFAEKFRKEEEETLSDSARSGAEDKSQEGDIQNMGKVTEEKTEVEPGATPSPDPAPVATKLSEEDRKKLKDEAKAEFAEEQKAKDEENAELRKKVHRMTVDSKIADLSESLSGHPGILKEVRNIMLADESGSTILTLSETEGEGDAKEVKLSATDIVERIIDVLPKKDGKVNFGEQTNSSENHGEPKVDAEEEKLSVEERAAAFAEDLGIEDYPAPKKEGDA